MTDTNPELREALLKAKLEQCCLICQFESTPLDGASAYTSTDALSDGSGHGLGNEPVFVSPAELRNREIKRVALLELIELISQLGPARAIPDSMYPYFFAMVRQTQRNAQASEHSNSIPSPSSSDFKKYFPTTSTAIQPRR